MMNATQAQAIAERAVKTVDSGSDFEYVGKMTIVAGRDKFGYFVADNGDESSGLTRESALVIIAECLVNA